MSDDTQAMNDLVVMRNVRVAVKGAVVHLKDAEAIMPALETMAKPMRSNPKMRKFGQGLEKVAEIGGNLSAGAGAIGTVLEFFGFWESDTDRMEADRKAMLEKQDQMQEQIQRLANTVKSQHEQTLREFLRLSELVPQAANWASSKTSFERDCSVLRQLIVSRSALLPANLDKSFMSCFKHIGLVCEQLQDRSRNPYTLFLSMMANQHTCHKCNALSCKEHAPSDRSDGNAIMKQLMGVVESFHLTEKLLVDAVAFLMQMIPLARKDSVKAYTADMAQRAKDVAKTRKACQPWQDSQFDALWRHTDKLLNGTIRPGYKGRYTIRMANNHSPEQEGEFRWKANAGWYLMCANEGDRNNVSSYVKVASDDLQVGNLWYLHNVDVGSGPGAPTYRVQQVMKGGAGGKYLTASRSMVEDRRDEESTYACAVDAQKPHSGAYDWDFAHVKGNVYMMELSRDNGNQEAGWLLTATRSYPLGRDLHISNPDNSSRVIVQDDEEALCGETRPVSASVYHWIVEPYEP